MGLAEREIATPAALDPWRYLTTPGEPGRGTMTAPIRQRAPLAASDERVIVRRGAARRDRAVAAAGALPAKPRRAGCGLISLPRLSAHDHDDVTLLRLRGELDLSGTAVLHAQLRDIRWQARARSVADLTGLPSPAAPPSACLPGAASRSGNGLATLPRGGPQAAVRPVLPVIGLLTWSRRTTPPGTPSLELGGPIDRLSCGPLSSPRSPLAAQQRAPAPSSPRAGAGLRERGSVRRRRHVQPRHAHDHILGVHQCAAILPPCPESGQRRSSF